jgi:catechol 2,3-dioxygenase-like lactoylglutathione lyase family enzyme
VGQPSIARDGELTRRPRKGGTIRIGLTGIVVDDQDQAERFYTEVVGLQVKTSTPYGPDERWLSVVAPQQPDGVELVLHLVDLRKQQPHLVDPAHIGLDRSGPTAPVVDRSHQRLGRALAARA